MELIIDKKRIYLRKQQPFQGTIFAKIELDS